jgi:ABC-2 type transport system ATP-binding protein
MFAMALATDPDLLVLDEPTTGLDPGGMRDMRVLIRRLSQQGITIVLSSHLLPEVEELCNRVAIVQTGKIVYEGEIAALKRSAGASYSLSTTDDGKALEVARAQPGIENVRLQQQQVWFNAGGERAVADLSQALVESGALILSLTPQTATLEQLFFSLTEGPEKTGSPDPSDQAEPAELAT